MGRQLRLFPNTPYKVSPPEAAPDECDETVMVSSKTVGELSEAEAADCTELTLESGSMRCAFQWLRALAKDKPRARRARTAGVVLLRREGRLVAWALTQELPHEGTVAYLFVACDQRRRGLGQVLVRQVLARCPRARFCPWDEGSVQFFSACSGVVFTARGARYAAKQSAQAA